jgi:DNA-binding LacI/PurR family transcriptional regulator
VRRALALLKVEGIVRSVQGSGTCVTLPCRGFQGKLDIVVLVALMLEPFLADFLGHFENAADRTGTLVVFKQVPSRAAMESAAFYQRFLDKGIRDFVLWPIQGFDGSEILPRLRGLGVNLVFFDHVVETPYADCVSLDNRDAVETLVTELFKRKVEAVHLVGWSDVPLSSTAEREQAFARRAGPNSEIFRVSRNHDTVPSIIRIAERFSKGKKRVGLLCMNIEIGRAVRAAVHRENASNIEIAVIDAMPPSGGPEVLCLEQPLKRLAEKVFRCLLEQNQKGSAWAAGQHTLKGTFKMVGVAG